MRVSCVSCGAVGKKQGERANESESQTGSWQHNIMSVGRGRARRAAGAEWERAGLSFSFVWRDLTKWRFVQKTTTLYPHWEREGGRDGWRAIRVPLFNCNQDTLHRTPSNLATRRLAFFPTTKWLLSSRPNLLLIPLSPSCPCLLLSS